MAIVPDFVLSVVNAHLQPLLAWFSEWVYAKLLKRDPDHFLVRLQRQLDFAPLEKACAGFHHSAGPGTLPTHTVPRLVRALLLGYLFAWSLRQLEFHIRFNLLVKWFVGYRVAEPGPDHSTLERFEQWACMQQHRTFFDEVLRQIDAQFPAEPLQPQIGDTFALQANAAKEPLIRLIRHTAQKLLWTLEDLDPPSHAAVRAQLDLVALLGATDEPSEYRLDAAGRQARLQTTVLAALQCAQLVEQQLQAAGSLPQAARQPVHRELRYLRKVIADEVALTRDDAGQVSAVHRLPPDQRGSYRLGSATDPEATYRVHGEDKIDFGYNVNLAVSQHFVRAIQADTGAQPDNVGIPDLLTAQAEHQGFLPPKLIYDQAAGTGKTLAAVAAATQGQTQLVSPMVDYDKRTKRFGPADFTLSPDGASLTCPQGQVSSLHYASGAGEGQVFRFTAQQCQGCPLWSQCRDPKADPQNLRQVFISDYRPLVEAAKAYQQTEAYKADMKQRPLVERVIANLTRYCDGRRCRRLGQLKADFQAKMCAVAFNLKQWLALLGRQVSRQ